MATKITPALSAKVQHKEGFRLRVVTDVTILLSDIEVATATIGGNWNQQNALKEFQRNPNRFAKVFPGYDMARSFKLVK